MKKFDLFIIIVATVIMGILAYKMKIQPAIIVGEPIREIEDAVLKELAPITEYHISFEGISQDTIPTGCESVCAVAVLKHMGVEIAAEQFVKEFLPQQEFYRMRGRWYGADPNEYFAGNPMKSTSLGCFPNVIVKAVTAMKVAQYVGTDNIEAQDLTGTSLEALEEMYIQNDIPVLIWVTADMVESEEGISYLLEDGSRYTWRAKEHCVVLCGYDEEYYYVMDPLKDGEIVSYSKDLVETRYQEMQERALVMYEA